jgi:thymidylate synthase (FAD)
MVSKIPVFRRNMTVELVRHMAGDHVVTEAAKVSTKGAASLGSEKSVGLINMLMRDRHGSPFEHSVMTWYIETPIFVWREFMRHRMASYNEESGRYKQLEPMFYLPSAERNLQQIGKAGAYEYVPGTPEQERMVEAHLKDDSITAYQSYERMLEMGVAREVARMSLPLNIYSSAYVTMNSRALMNFLSLRTKSEASTFPSFPQREIEMVAEQMEEHFYKLMPDTHTAFVKNGRVAP